MTTTSGNPSNALNELLSEVIDLVQDVKQGHRKVGAHPLHAELDLLLADLRAWAQLLLEKDEALGLSPLAGMPSVAGRKPPNLWPGPASDKEVSGVVGEHLARLGDHVSAVMAAQEHDDARVALGDIERGVTDHRRRLSEFAVAP